MGLLDRFKRPDRLPDDSPDVPVEPVVDPNSDAPKWFKRALAERPQWMAGDMKVTLLDTTAVDDIAVVGESFYQEALWYVVRSEFEHGERVSHPIVAVLNAERDNPHDRNAIAVWIDGFKVGHFNREDAAAFRPSLDALLAEHGPPIALHGTISGGGQRDDGPGNLGVWLYYDPEHLFRSK